MPSVEMYVEAKPGFEEAVLAEAKQIEGVVEAYLWSFGIKVKTKGINDVEIGA